MDLDTGPSDRTSRRRPREQRGRLGRLRAGLSRRVGGLFSVRAFALALAGAVAGLFAGNLILPLGGVAGVLGVLAAALLGGLVFVRRAYLEWAAAGALTGGVSIVLDFLVISLATGAGVDIAFVGAGAGAVAGVVGHYFGRDLRDGLTGDLPG